MKKLTLRILEVLEACVDHAESADAMSEGGDLEHLKERDVNAANVWLADQRKALAEGARS